MNMHHKHTQPRYLLVRGFTLIELMVVVAIIAILAAIAFPSFQSLIQNNRIQAASSEFQAGLAMARAEAIKRGGDARVTMVANALTAGTATANWNSGFTIFYDTTGNANGLAPPATGSPNILMVTSATNTNINIKSNMPSYVSYNGLGRTIGITGGNLSGSFVFETGSTASDSVRCLAINSTGRTRSARYSVAEFTAISSSCGI